MTMNEKYMRELRKQVFRKNPGIDPQLVEKHERLEKELAKLGVQIKPEYDLEPPLGDDSQRYKYARRRSGGDLANTGGEIRPEYDIEPPLGRD